MHSWFQTDWRLYAAFELLHTYRNVLWGAFIQAADLGAYRTCKGENNKGDTLVYDGNFDRFERAANAAVTEKSTSWALKKQVCAAASTAHLILRAEVKSYLGAETHERIVVVALPNDTEKFRDVTSRPVGLCYERIQNWQKTS